MVEINGIEVTEYRCKHCGEQVLANAADIVFGTRGQVYCCGPCRDSGDNIRSGRTSS
jgi:predicted SprT family Zn-dependent metalloprotease